LTGRVQTKKERERETDVGNKSGRVVQKRKKKTKEKWGGITLYRRRRRRVDIDVWPVCCS
jgi:hypothetical protein